MPRVGTITALMAIFTVIIDISVKELASKSLLSIRRSSL